MSSPSGFSCSLCDGAAASFIILMGPLMDHGLFHPICLTAQADPNITHQLTGELHTFYSCFSPMVLDTENSGPSMSLIS